MGQAPRGSPRYLTNGGGAGVMAADAAALAGLPLRTLGDALRAKLDAALPATWSHGNPVDIIGDAPGERYAKALESCSGTERRRHPGAEVPNRGSPPARTPPRCNRHRRRASRAAYSPAWLGEDAPQQARNPSASTA
jgi:acetyltransferase